MNKTASIIITVGLVIAMGVIFIGGSDQAGKNVEIRDGIQYITIGAQGGYSPEISNAKAGILTKLIVKTNGTYDCSASLVIRSIGYQKILPQTGEEIIDVGVPKVGVPLQGTCGMGMYSFVVRFS